MARSYFDDRTGLMPLPPTAGGGLGGYSMGDLMRMQSRQRMTGMLTGIGAGLLQAGMGGPYGSQQQGLSAAMQAMNQGQADPMDYAKAQYMMGQLQTQQATAAQKQAQQEALTRYSAMTPEEKAGPEGQRLAALADPDEYMASQLQETDRYGPAQKDPNTGLWYQENLSDGSRKYAPMPLEDKLRLAREGKLENIINLPGERETERSKKYGGKVGEHFAEAYSGMLTSANKARQDNARMNAQEALLSRTYTGMGGQTAQNFRKLGKMLGVGNEELEDMIASGEAGQALADEAALAARDTSGGAGLPGSVSNEDRNMLQGMSGGMAMTKKGRETLFTVRRRLNQRKIDVARDAREYSKKHGQVDEGFYDLLDEKYASDPTKSLFAGLDMPEEAGSITGGLTMKDAGPLGEMDDQGLVSMDTDSMSEEEAQKWLSEMDRRGL